MNQLDALRQWTTVVADTGDFRQLAQFKPQDATTNPSLILKAVQKAEYRPLLDEAVNKHGSLATDEIIDRLLVKIASTWEGIEAARQLEQKGIHCNLTLLFSFSQAVACGAARVQLISPFVGRIYDWHKKSAGTAWDEAARSGANDPGVRSVRQIFEYYKKHGIATEVMGASFRNVGQIAALAGCDLLTISPELLAELAASEAPIAHSLDAEAAQRLAIPRVSLDEAAFRFALNEDAMATEKLAEGIRAFAADAVKLEKLMES